MNVTRIIYVSATLFIFLSTASFVHAWGVTVSDPALVAIRNTMIKQIGVDRVVSSRFEAATDRLSILDRRITSRIDKTANTCTMKKDATQMLSSARSVLTTAESTINSVATIDKTIAKTAEASLQRSLDTMQAAVTTIASCPEYQSVNTINTMR